MYNNPKYITIEEIFVKFKKTCSLCGSNTQLTYENNELVFLCTKCSNNKEYRKYLPTLRTIKKVNKEMIEMSVFNDFVQQYYNQMEVEGMQRAYLADKYEPYLDGSGYDNLDDFIDNFDLDID